MLMAINMQFYDTGWHYSAVVSTVKGGSNLQACQRLPMQHLNVHSVWVSFGAEDMQTIVLTGLNGKVNCCLSVSAL